VHPDIGNGFPHVNWYAPQVVTRLAGLLRLSKWRMLLGPPTHPSDALSGHGSVGDVGCELDAFGGGSAVVCFTNMGNRFVTQEKGGCHG